VRPTLVVVGVGGWGGPRQATCQNLETGFLSAARISAISSRHTAVRRGGGQRGAVRRGGRPERGGGRGCGVAQRALRESFVTQGS